jgi:hypothetical protein
MLPPRGVAEMRFMRRRSAGQALGCVVAPEAIQTYHVA